MPIEDLQVLDARQMYIDLIKRCVLNIPYVDAELNPIQPHGTLRKASLGIFRSAQIQLAHLRRGDYERRIAGHDFSDIAHSMLSFRRLNNIQMCVETILRDQVPGDFIETGVMRGGAVILMRAILRAYGVRDRKVWAADSFKGLPPPNPKEYPADEGAQWHLRPLTEVAVEHIKRNFERSGLLDHQVQFLPGWFRDTLPTAPIERLALLRLDGDLYESTMDALVPLYPRLAPGGFVIVDDYNLPMCERAVNDYRGKMGIDEKIVTIDDAGIYWRKTQAT
jgi:macrocin-O-methyltransferase TylF-like protien